MQNKRLLKPGILVFRRGIERIFAIKRSMGGGAWGLKRNHDYFLLLLLASKAVGEINIAGLPGRKSLRT